jgi:hypothetical protein
VKSLIDYSNLLKDKITLSEAPLNNSEKSPAIDNKLNLKKNLEKWKKLKKKSTKIGKDKKIFK